MSVLSAGQLNCRITIKSANTELDPYGSLVPGWQDVMTVWAGIQPLSGRELESARQLSSEVTHQITVRYHALLANTRQVSTYRALYKGRVFNLHAALNEDENNVLITLLASEGLDRE